MTQNDNNSVWVSYTAAADFWGDAQHSQLSLRRNTKFLVDIKQHGQPGWLWGTTGDKTGWVPEWAAEVSEKRRKPRRSQNRISPTLDKVGEDEDGHSTRRRSRRHSSTNLESRDQSWRIKLDSMESLSQANMNKSFTVMGLNKSHNKKDRLHKTTDKVNRLADITGLKVPKKSAGRSSYSSTESVTSRTSSRKGNLSPGDSSRKSFGSLRESSRKSFGALRDRSRRGGSKKKNDAFDFDEPTKTKKPLFGKLLSRQSGLNLVGTPQA